MKAYDKNLPFVYPVYMLWYSLMQGIVFFSDRLLPLRMNYLGAIPWGNFDGQHYWSIARFGYTQFQYAFFPLYPILIRGLSNAIFINEYYSGWYISQICFVIGVYFFYRLSAIENSRNGLWALLLLLVFPTSFFFNSVYTNGLYFLLATVCLYLSKERKWILASIFGMLAAATSIFGAYLLVPVLYEYNKQQKHGGFLRVAPLVLIPLGLLAYMTYLWITLGDPIAFFHVQPAFGANRSGDGFIFLPQVLWRYLKILTTVAPTIFEYKIALLELGTFVLSGIALWLGYKKKVNISYIIYSALVIVTPTLTGTLSSFPRYFLSAFPLFIMLAQLKSSAIKGMLVIVFLVLLIYVCSAFLQGYFVG